MMEILSLNPEMLNRSSFYEAVARFNNTTEATNTTGIIPKRREDLARVEIIVQSIILFLAIFGNTCVIIALCRRKQKPSRMHMFILHLSIADLLVAFFNILPQLVWDITFEWTAGDVMCRLVKFAQVFVMYLSTYVLIITAIDRYRAVCHPLSNHLWTSKRVHSMVASAYVISALFSIPQPILFKYQDTGLGTDTKDCWVKFDPEWTLTFYVLALTLFLYIVPLLVLIYCYGMICFKICQKHRQAKSTNNHYDTLPKLQRPTMACKTNGCYRNSIVLVPKRQSFRGLTRAKLKTVKLTFVIILAYLFCCSPFYLSQLWWLLDESAPMGNGWMVICLLLASLNSCCNPWIYLAFSGNLIKNLLPLSWCSATKQNKRKHARKRFVFKPKQRWTFKSSDSLVANPQTRNTMDTVKRHCMVKQQLRCEDIILLEVVLRREGMTSQSSGIRQLT